MSNLNLLEIVQRHASQRPDKRAFTLLGPDESATDYVTYSELERHSRAIGALLQSFGAKGERALILHPYGLEFVAAFLGCLYAGVTAVPAYQPRAGRPDAQLGGIRADSQATIALAPEQAIAGLTSCTSAHPGLAGLHLVATDKVLPELADGCQGLDATDDALAYLQYTSGSTGDPKGVMVSHGNLRYNLAYLNQALELRQDSSILMWAPLFHDMGLVSGVLLPLYTGCSGFLLPPTALSQQPIRWLKAISRYRVTHSGGPNFAYDLCVEKTTPEQRESLDLTNWIVACNGAERVRQDTITRFAEMYEPYGFRSASVYTCYGLAEAVLMVSGGRVAAAPVYCTVKGAALAEDRVEEAPVGERGALTLIGNGFTADDTRMAIVHPKRRTQCGPDEVGEIWVAGPGVAKGFWNCPEETRSIFGACLADTREGPFLRTGDLGFIKGGELFVTGRINEMIVVGGCNHYPQDIELSMSRSHPALEPNSGAAFSIDDPHGERLVVVQEVRRQWRHRIKVEQIAMAVRQAVCADHGLRVYAVVLIKPGSISRTSSGKIQRYLCRNRFLEGSLDVIGANYATEDTECSTPQVRPGPAASANSLRQL